MASPVPYRPMVFAAAVFIAGGLSLCRASDRELSIDPSDLSRVGQIDERFQSYNVEMAEVIGGRFWKPYSHMSANDPPPSKIDVGRDPNLFEARSPADLSDARLRALAAALGPAYVRVSGTWANSVYFQDDDAPVLPTAPEGYNGILTRAEWRGVLSFAKAVHAQLVTSFTISAGTRDSSGVWTAVQAKPLLEFTRSIGGDIFAAELFNEPNLAGYGGGLKGYDATAFARDSAVFRDFVTKSWPALKVAGPGDVTTANMPIPGAPTAEAFFTASPPPQFDVFSYHFYPAVSQRCAPPGSAGVSTSQDQALTEQWLARTDAALTAHKAVRDKFVPNIPIWITETAQAACGGSPWAATFTDTFRYLDQMGRLARQGVSVIFHNTLAASEYGLIEPNGFEPRPNYWAALLWRRLMGTVVLNAGPSPAGLHMYAHCLRDTPGGVALLAINLDSQARSIRVSSSRVDSYALSAATLESSAVSLNGRPLTLGSDNVLPEVHPARIHARQLKLAAHSIDFIALPQAANSQCK